MTIRKFIIVAGAQGGNEGKGRIVDELITRNVEEHGAENVGQRPFATTSRSSNHQAESTIFLSPCSEIIAG